MCVVYIKVNYRLASWLQSRQPTYYDLRVQVL